MGKIYPSENSSESSVNGKSGGANLIHPRNKLMKGLNPICAISICILISISGCIFSKPLSSGKHGFTAMEKYPEALNISRGWKNDSALTDATGSLGFDRGRADIWKYSFISNSSIHIIDNTTTRYEQITILMYANGSQVVNYYTGSNASPIINWIIDSDQAYQIMMREPSIKEYTSKPGAHRTSFDIVSPSIFSELKYRTGPDKDDAVWYAEWTRSSEYPPPLSQEIWISAFNGTMIFS